LTSGDAWVHLLTHCDVSGSTDALIAILEKATDPNLQAKAADELKTRQLPYTAVASISYGNSLTLRAAAR
jgi:hypothetical protein